MPKNPRNKLKLNERIRYKPEPEPVPLEAERVRIVADKATDYSEVFQKTPFEKMMLKLAKRKAREEEEAVNSSEER